MFFLSGAAGLAFEMAWFHRCGLLFGSTVWAASIALSSFMGGLAIGNALAGRFAYRIRRPLHTYAAAELIVGLSGIAVLYVLSAHTLTASLSRVVSDDFWTLNAFRFVATFAALLVPATAMGTTLPLLTEALCRQRLRFGSVLGRLYGWNTLGAVCGALGAELVLVRRFGVTGTAWVAALLDCGVGAAALWLGSREAGASDESRTQRAQRVSAAPGSAASAISREPGVPRRLLIAAGLAGANLLVLEVIWLRFLSMFVLTTTLAMSVMLAVVLGAIGVGALAASRWVARRSSLADGAPEIPIVALAAGCALVASYAWFQAFAHGTQIGDSWRMAWFACVLASPTAFLSGVIFTLLGERIARQVGSAERAAASLTLANTLGAMPGPLLASFLFLPTLGMERSFYLIAASYGALALVTFDRRTLASRNMALVSAAVAFVVSLVAFPFGSMRETYFARAAAPYAADGSRIVATREGAAETIFLMRQTWMGQTVYDRLVTNGFSMSGTAVSALRYMRDFVYLPALLHTSPLRRALVVCYGVGVTAGAVTDIPSIESIDVVEISRDVVAMSDVIYAHTRHPLRDPRVRLHLEDARYFLETTPDRFDLITGEPPPPRTPGAVNIYTREYFRLIHDKLADGGMTTYWLPVARPDPGTDVDTIVRAFCDVFDDCSLWNATPFDLMLLGTRRADGPAVPAAFDRTLITGTTWTTWTTSTTGATAPLTDRLREIGFEQPEQIGATFLGDAAFVRHLTADTPALTDDYPQRLRPDAVRLSLSDPRYGTTAAVRELYQRVIDPDRARQAFQTSPLVRHLFPPALIASTVPFFDVQRIVNRVLWEGGNPLRLIDDLDAVITRTSLQTLPLWILGSDDVKQRIASSTDDGSGGAEYARGLEHLAKREYLAAASELAAAEQRGLRAATVRPLLVYALCRGGNLAGAARLARGAGAPDADAGHFWAWMGAHFGVGAAGH
jgi:spermidine synthase